MANLLLPKVKEGDSIPSTPLVESSPGEKIDLSQELSSGKGLIIGVPAAFSPGCSGKPSKHNTSYKPSVQLPMWYVLTTA